MKNPSSNPVFAGPHPFGTREGLALEFKEAADALPRNFFETVCAFLNLDGGLIVLGVADDGTVTGVASTALDRLKVEIASQSNNPNKLDPPSLLSPHAEQIDGKWIVKVQVPASSQVHRVNGEVFLRSEDGDFRIRELNRIASLVNRKLSFFTEQKVLPYLDLGDLRPDLFDKARKLMRTRTPLHPWADLAPEELLRIAGFVRKDIFTNQTGFTLATALMFGTDAIIQSVVPGYKFDALLRRRDTERYDDRLIVRTNLIDAYDLLMGFVEKHLDDPFYLEGTMSVSLRDRIFRELIANIIAHREYTSTAPATMVIYRDRVEFKNPNIPHGHGRLDPAHFTPHPKNPTICKFLMQLGRFDELGSGVTNVTKYQPLYAPGTPSPSFTEDEMFTAIVPLTPASAEKVTEVGTKSGPSRDQVDILHKCLKDCPIGELMALTGRSNRTKFRDQVLKPLLDDGLIAMTISAKPTSRLQKYRLTPKGAAFLKAHEPKA